MFTGMITACFLNSSTTSDCVSGTFNEPTIEECISEAQMRVLTTIQIPGVYFAFAECYPIETPDNPTEEELLS